MKHPGNATASAVVQFSAQNQMKRKYLKQMSSRPQMSHFSRKIKRKTKTKLKKVNTSADVQSSTYQWDDLSEIRNFFVVSLKLLRGPQGTSVPSLRTIGIQRMVKCDVILNPPIVKSWLGQ